MRTFVRRWPAIALLLMAMLLGFAPVVAVNVGALPEAWSQLGALSSSVAGIVLAFVAGGKAAVRELLGRFLIWRVGWRWWAIALLFAVVPSVIALYLYELLGGPPVDWTGLKPLYTVVPMIVLLTVLAGVGEEFGWRGFALPRLQSRHNALQASLIVGVIWGIWHIPLFFTRGNIQDQFRMDVGPLVAILAYVLFVIAASIQFTWLFNNTRGSVLLAAVFHGAMNAWGGYIDVYRGHFSGVLVFAAISVLISILIVVFAGPEHLSRSSSRNVLNSNIE